MRLACDGFLDTGTSVATAIAAREDAVFVVHSCRAPSCTNTGITAFDPANPAAPAVWSTLSIPTLTRGMDIEVLGAFAYAEARLLCGSGVQRASMIVPVGKHDVVADDGGFGVVQLQ